MHGFYRLPACVNCLLSVTFTYLLTYFFYILPIYLEDDMKVPSKEKEKPLCEFYTHLADENWTLSGCKFLKAY